jgi:hypothetical protein
MKESRTTLKQPLLKLMDQNCAQAGYNKDFKFIGIDRFRRMYAWPTMMFNCQQFESFSCTPKLEDTVIFNFATTMLATFMWTILKIMVSLFVLSMSWDVVIQPRLETLSKLMPLRAIFYMDSYGEFLSRSSRIIQ